MDKFQFKYIDDEGEQKTSYIYVENVDIAIEKLNKEYKEVVNIKKIRFNFINKYIENRKINSKYIYEFCDKLNVLLKAGIPIHKSLFILERQMTNKENLKKIKLVRASILNGNSFSSSLKEQNMPMFMCDLIEVGETTGRLEETLDMLYSYYYDKSKLYEIIKNSTYYPMVVMIAMIFAIIVSVFSVIPNYAIIFESNGESLPYLTLMLLNISDFFINNVVLIFFSLSLILILTLVFINIKIGRRIIDLLKIKIRVFDSIYLNNLNHNFSLTMYILLNSSIDLINSLKITKNILNNEIVAIHIEEIIKNVENGLLLSECLSEYNEFSSILISLCEVGEETGNLSECFYKSSKIFKNNINSFLNTFEKKVEVAITLILGLVLGIIMLSIVLPTFTIVNTI